MSPCEIRAVDLTPNAQLEEESHHANRWLSPSSKGLLGAPLDEKTSRPVGVPIPRPSRRVPSPYFHSPRYGLILSDHIESDDSFILELLEYIP